MKKIHVPYVGMSTKYATFCHNRRTTIQKTVRRSMLLKDPLIQFLMTNKCKLQQTCERPLGTTRSTLTEPGHNVWDKALMDSVMGHSQSSQEAKMYDYT